MDWLCHLFFILFLLFVSALGILDTTSDNHQKLHLLNLPDVESLRSLVLSGDSNTVAAESFQSNVCSPTDEKLQRQCFAELPKDNYEVLEGLPVRMRCRVARQKGKTQWRAHNTLLGYDRNLHDWPKYSMQGDADRGEHDLVISSVSREDAGNFECQVSPTANQPLLRRNTNLSILIAPSKPIILATPGEPQPTKNGQLIIARPFPGSGTKGDVKEGTGNGDNLRLVCQAKGGIPPPTFEWFHNGLPVRNLFDRETTKELRRSVFPGSGSYFGETVDATTKKEQSKDEEAMLIIPKTELDSGDRLTCIVSNKATQRASNLQQKLMAEIIVTVQTPPGSPVILSDVNLMDSIVKNEDEALMLTCQSKPPGSPPGELTWRWEDPPIHTSSELPFSASMRQKQRMPNLEQFTQNSFDKNQLESRLILPAVKRIHNGMSIVCITRHKLGLEQKTKVLLNVRYALSGVCIYQSISTNRPRDEAEADCVPSKDQDINKVLYVHPDRQQIFACSTTAFYGHATIKWFGAYASRDPNSHTLEWHDLSNFTSIAELKRGGVNYASYIKTVSLRIPYLSKAKDARNELRMNMLQCRGYPSVDNFDTEAVVIDQVILKSYEAPKKPVIRIESKSEKLVEGDILQLRCEAEDGDPEGKLSWLKAIRNGAEYAPIYLISTTEHDQDRHMMSSKLDIHLAADDHCSSFKCAATNPGFPISEFLMSEPFHVNITFRPQQISIQKVGGDHLSSGLQQIPSLTVTAGELVNLECTAGPANPPASLDWSHLHCDIPLPSSPGNTTNYSFYNSDPASVVGKACALLNKFSNAKSLPPQSTSLVSRSQISLLVQPGHHESIIECTTVVPEESATVWEADKLLKTHLLLNVLFKPNFSNVVNRLNSTTSKYLPQYVIVEGASLNLDITPLANPPITSAKWFHRKFESDSMVAWMEITDRISNSFSDNPGMLRLPRVDVDHMGSYRVIGVNEIGSADLVFFLNVTHAPRLIGDALVNVTTTTGREAELVCRVMANPPPRPSSVYWRRINDDDDDDDDDDALTTFTSTSNNKNNSKSPTPSSHSIADLKCNQELSAGRVKYFVKCFSAEPFHLVSTLYITEVDQSDVGRYECFVDNGIGSPVIRLIDLIYPFSPRVLQLNRWMRAAPPYILPNQQNFGYQQNHTTTIQGNLVKAAPVPPTLVVCVIAAEPAPTVSWFREPANLTLVEGGQFKSTVTRMYAGRYRATLSIEFVRKTDFGSYFCRAKNTMGFDVGKVLLGPTTFPDKPGRPVLIKATSSALTVGWLQGFNGGPPQTFIVKWAPKDSPESVLTSEVSENPSSALVKHTIENLSPLANYRVCVAAKNSLQKTSPFTDYLLAGTKAPAPSEQAMRDEARRETGGLQQEGSVVGQMAGGTFRNEGGDNDRVTSNMTIIITVATCFGCLIFLTNLIIVGLVLHRRHQRRNSKLKRIPGSDSLVKCGVMETYPTTDCYPDRFLNGQHVFGPYMDSGSQKDSLSQYQFEHFGQCSPNMPQQYISSGSYLHRESPLNLFANSPALISGSTLPEHPLQTMQRLNSMSQSSSPLHSSRSHGIQQQQIQQDAMGINLVQRHPSFAGYPDQQAQSIYLVAAPNPMGSSARFAQDAGSDGDLNPLSLYLNSDNLGINSQIMSQPRIVPMADSNQGTVSPHSTTDKSIGSERGILCQDNARRVPTSPYCNQTDFYNGRIPTTLTRFQAPTSSTAYPAPPRMITSFYTQRIDANQNQNLIGPSPGFGQIPRRNSTDIRGQNELSHIHDASLLRKQRPIVTFTNDGRELIMNSNREQTHMPLNEVDSQDLTLSSDVATIPPPTDFGHHSNALDPDDNHYPNMMNRHLDAWRHDSGCVSTRLPGINRNSRGTILPDGSTCFTSTIPSSSSVEKSGVHFDLSM